MGDTTSRKRHIIRVDYTLEELAGGRWVAHAPDIRATAEGDTQEEAYLNLQALVHRYPEVLDEVKQEPPELELVRLLAAV